MSYKLGQQNQVQHVESGAWIPAIFEKGAVVALDEYSPFVQAFAEWVEAGNTPDPADQPSPQDVARAEIAGINVQTDSPRWVRQGILGLGELVDLIRNIPPEVVTVEQLLAYLRSIPPCGSGMTKLQAVEAREVALRSSLAK